MPSFGCIRTFCRAHLPGVRPVQDPALPKRWPTVRARPTRSGLRSVRARPGPRGPTAALARRPARRAVFRQAAVWCRPGLPGTVRRASDGARETPDERATLRRIASANAVATSRGLGDVMESSSYLELGPALDGTVVWTCEHAASTVPADWTLAPGDTRWFTTHWGYDRGAAALVRALQTPWWSGRVRWREPVGGRPQSRPGSRRPVSLAGGRAPFAPNVGLSRPKETDGWHGFISPTMTRSIVCSLRVPQRAFPPCCSACTRSRRCTKASHARWMRGCCSTNTMQAPRRCCSMRSAGRLARRWSPTNPGRE